MTDKRVSRIGIPVGRMGAAIPAGIPPILRRFWDFTRNMAGKFSKQLPDPEKYEEKFVNVVEKDAKHWG